MPKILLYTTKSCPYCRAAREFLDRENLVFDDIPVDNNPSLRQEIKAKYRWSTVPAIIINGSFLGGFDDMMKMHASGELAKILAK